MFACFGQKAQPKKEKKKNKRKKKSRGENEVHVKESWDLKWFFSVLDMDWPKAECKVDDDHTVFDYVWL